MVDLSAVVALPTVTDRQEGFDRIALLEKKCGESLTRMAREGINLVRLRWEEGRAAQTLLDMGVSMADIASRGNASSRTLYQAIAFVKRCPTMPAVNLQFAKWSEEEPPRPISWRMVRSWAAKALPETPDRAGVFAKQKRSVERRLEARQVELRDLVEQARDTGTEDDALEVAGIVTRATQFVEESQHELLEAQQALEAPTRLQDERYLRYIRSCRCLLCGSPEGVQAHHTDRGGHGTKGSDHRTVPVCTSCHSQIHQHGDEAVWGGFGINSAIIDLLSEYLARQNHFKHQANGQSL